MLRRNVLKVGFGLMGVGLLAACGAPAVTTAPTSAPATLAPAATTATPAADGIVFQIDPNTTKASFSIGEVLLGKPNTVVGTTSKVNGSITANPGNPASTKIGTIQIDATTFTTDSDMRNGAIKRFILQSAQSQYQFITFEPTKIDGLTGAVNIGTAVPVKVTGNLKVKDAIKPVTFEGTVMLKSDTQIDGNLKATVTRSDFGLTIPNVPSVADVTEEVKLELQFTAMKQ
jgi:polyisoprenoid-binding protein YceI